MAVHAPLHSTATRRVRHGRRRHVRRVHDHPARGGVKIDDDIPFEIASLIGCGVTTGVGAAINTAKVTPGLVGRRVRLRRRRHLRHPGRQVAGAAVIVAVDLVDAKLEEAKRSAPPTPASPTSSTASRPSSPATASTTPSRPSACPSRCGPPTTPSAAAARPASSASARWTRSVSFNAFELFFSEKNLQGQLLRLGRRAHRLPPAARLWKAGQLDLDGMITRRIKLDDINDAFDA